MRKTKRRSSWIDWCIGANKQINRLESEIAGIKALMRIKKLELDEKRSECRRLFMLTGKQESEISTLRSEVKLKEKTIADYLGCEVYELSDIEGIIENRGGS